MVRATAIIQRWTICETPSMGHEQQLTYIEKDDIDRSVELNHLCQLIADAIAGALCRNGDEN
jgi:hypothetical protein